MVLLFLGDVGGGELALIAVVALVVLGPQRFPEIAKKMGQLMGQFRRASTDLQRQLNNELRDAGDPNAPADNAFGAKAAAWATRLKAELSSTMTDAPKAPSAADPVTSQAAEVVSSRPLPPGIVESTAAAPSAAEPSPAPATPTGTPERDDEAAIG